jgi:hypothetical protein
MVFLGTMNVTLGALAYTAQLFLCARSAAKGEKMLYAQKASPECIAQSTIQRGSCARGCKACATQMGVTAASRDGAILSGQKTLSKN